MDIVNIAKVAQLAEVSQSTVSRVLNNSGYVAAPTRERVHKVIQRLGYRKNLLARKLRIRESRFVGLLIPNITNDFLSRLAKKIEHVLQSAGYALFLCNSEEDTKREDFYINTLLDNQVEAIVITPATKTPNKHLLKSNIPVVCVDRLMEIDRKNIAFVTSDNETGGKLAAERFMMAGAKNIVLLCDKYSGSSAVEERVRGFMSIVDQHQGIAVELIKIRIVPDAAYAAIERLLPRKKIDAVFCTSDILALGALRCFMDHEIAVPDSAQLIGFDGISFGIFLPKRISTIAQDTEGMGTAVGNIVLSMIQKRDYENMTVVPVSFVEGDTTLKDESLKAHLSKAG